MNSISLICEQSLSVRNIIVLDMAGEKQDFTSPTENDVSSKMPISVFNLFVITSSSNRSHTKTGVSDFTINLSKTFIIYLSQISSRSLISSKINPALFVLSKASCISILRSSSDKPTPNLDALTLACISSKSPFD